MSSLSSSSSSSRSELPLLKIPGDYGLPFFGPIRDRFDYFYNQGQDEFFKTRMQKYHSTVFRANMPPGPFISSDSKVVVLLDAVSFPVLFDSSKVEKRNVLDGTFMPSTDLTGGYRVLAFLDPSEPKHDLLKRFSFSLLASRHRDFIPVFRPNIFSKWLFLQLSPLMTLGLSMLPNFIEDLLLHTFPLPPFLVKSDYNKLYKAFYESASSVLDEGERMGINRDEACHNLVFLAGFSTFGGMKVLFPPLIKWVGLAGEKLHRELADEIRTVVKAEGGVTFAALDKMALTKSVVYEALRIGPPVPFQYGKAREDMVIHSHDAAFEIKKGEMIFGYQPFATKDPKVFENPEDFVAHRFMGEGEKLLKYVYWSNGRETDNPTAENKQCSGKDLVVLISKLMLVEIFLRYDTFEVESGTMVLGSAVLFKSLTKSSYT
ncbi:unnamed protein product, partial [Vitis vinifera]